jgi:hypothetical protein
MSNLEPENLFYLKIASVENIQSVTRDIVNTHLVIFIKDSKILLTSAFIR